MKAKEFVKEDVQSIAGEEQVIRASIDSAQMGHIFKTLAGQYSDNVGSIVRELTSNCFDAHVEAGVKDEAVIVGFANDDNDNEYVFFRDFGGGMNPEFMRNVYMKYGNSTKRDSNEAIGMFGIGSKSPLSIKDEYYIVSRVDGIEYFYIIYYGNDFIPEVDVLDQNPTTEPNGTEVRIILDPETKYEYDHNGRWSHVCIEKNKFVKSIKEQLYYFSDVYFENVLNTTEQNDELNDYNVYEFDNFVSRTNPERNQRANICYKRVRYPINWDALDMEELPLPIGIKFDIGELRVTPGRENIVYEKHEIKVIKERIKATCYEIINKYNRRSFIHNELHTYLDKCEDYYLKYDNEIQISAQIAHDYLSSHYDVKWDMKTHNLKFLQDIGIKPTKTVVDSLIALCIDHSGTISNGRLNTAQNRMNGFRLVISNMKMGAKSGIYRMKVNEKSNPLINKTIDEGEVIKPRKSAKDYKQILEYVDQTPALLFNYEGYSNLKLSRFLYRSMLKLIAKCSSSYKTVEIHEDFLKKEELRQTYNLIVRHPLGNKVKDWERRYASIEDLNKAYSNYSRIVICKDPKTAHCLNRMKKFYHLKDHCSEGIDGIVFISCNMKNRKIIREGIDKAELFEEFAKTKVFANVCTAFHVEEKLKSIIDIDDKAKLDVIKAISGRTYDLIDTLREFISLYSIETSLTDSYYNKYVQTPDHWFDFIDECKDIAEKNSYLNYNVLSLLNEVKKYMNGLEIIDLCDPDSVTDIRSINIILKVVKSFGKRLDDKWYNFIQDDWQYQLIEDSNRKVEYLTSINRAA